MIKLKRSRIVSKIFFMVLVSAIESSQPFSVLIGSAMKKSALRWIRMVALIAAFDKICFGVIGRILKLASDRGQFPWLKSESKLIAYGTGAAVYLTRWRDGGQDKALRIYKKSIGEEKPGLIAVARHYQINHKNVLSWYGDVLIVPPMEFLVIDNVPFLGAVSASLQPYVHGEKKDVFEDFSEAELLTLLKVNSRAREQFIYFAKRTLGDWMGQKRLYDFVGSGNLVLLRQQDEYHLCILDVGIFDLEFVAKDRPELLVKIEERIDRLKRLRELAQEL